MKKRTFYSNLLTYFNHVLSGWKISLLSILLIVSFASNSQVTPANCTQGCTSNDVRIVASYLSDAAGNKLTNSFVCPGDGTADVYLTLELTTKTPRVGVSIFTRIKTLTASGPGAEVSGSPISQCFGIALNQPTNKVTFQQPFEWTCGTAIVMTDIFIGWGTGNTNFCGTSTGFICPATPSKCYQLPPGEFVAIETPVPQNASDSKCSAQPGGTTATFDLTTINVTSSSNVTITWWDDGPSTLANQINTPSAYSTATNTVYAKITSNADNTVFTVATVTLTVHQTPNLVITDPAAVCSPNTVDLTAGPVTVGSVLPATTTLTYWTNSNGTGAVGTPSAVGAGTYYIKATRNTTPTCSDIKSVTVTVVALPTALSLTGSSICSSAPNTGTITSTTSVSGVSYQLYNSANAIVQSAKAGTGSALTWTEVAAGNGYYVIGTGASPTNCTSTSNSVNVTSVANPTALSLTGSSICSSAPNTGTITSTTSVTGVNYQLYNSANAIVQAAQAGTGSALSWTGLAAGNGYYVVGTGAGPTNCSSTSNSVNVTSVTNPTALSLTGSAICTSAPNTGTISSTTSVSGVSYQLYNSANATVQLAQPGTGSALSWTGLAAGNGYYVIGTGTTPTNCTSTSNSVNVTSVSNPSAPSVTYNPPACDATTFSVTVTGVVSGATYTIKNRNGVNISGVLPGNFVVAPNGDDIVFSNIPAGSGYQVTVQVGACLSTANSCGQPDPPGARIQSVNQAEVMIEENATVKAYPNPFNDRVKFVITTPQAGYGSLDVMNMLGQKVKTVYQGLLNAGTQSFEMTLPQSRFSTLFYILRVNGKHVTGKLIQRN